MELKEYLRKAENGGDPQATVLGLLQDLQAGRVKADAIHAHYREEYWPRFMNMCAIFGAGNLFKAQRESFDEWLAGESWPGDFQKYLDFKAVCDMVREPKKALTIPAGMGLFMAKMVQPSPGARKAKVDAMGYEVARNGWADLCRREGWTWRALEG